ncbi:MAG: RNA methyltransferase [Candidatus Micrarchaeota archaeon]|nr:RNA methyltransferase [Candidatus Micrarchaeota archaeon]
MRIKLILVEPKYQVNLGYAARAAMNFGVKRLNVVAPRSDLRGRTAIMYSKHAHALLERARVYRTLGQAIAGCDIVIGTTGIGKKAKASFGRVQFAEKAMGRIGGKRTEGVAALLIGRDDIGLRSDEIERCDVVAYIPANPEYPVLNLSHALAILLYIANRSGFETEQEGEIGGESPEAGETRMALTLFERMISGKRMRNRRAVLNVFRRVLRNAMPNRQELHALITALK